MTVHIHERGLVPSIEGASLIGFHVVAPYLRGWRKRWGATPEECRRAYPGDDLIPNPRWSSTNAVSIQAPPEAVWPWLVQMGDGRAGLYSYQTLENMVGCKMRNLTVIAPDLQTLKPGDAIKLHDKIPGLPVQLVRPPEALLVGAPPDAAGVAATWGWFLTPAGKGATRLVARWRTVYPLTTGARLGYGQLLMEPITFVMSRKMLLGIKARAEAMALNSRVPQPV